MHIIDEVLPAIATRVLAASESGSGGGSLSVSASPFLFWGGGVSAMSLSSCNTLAQYSTLTPTTNGEPLRVKNVGCACIFLQHTFLLLRTNT